MGLGKAASKKMVGYSSYLRALAYQGQKRDKRALAELAALTAVSPDSSYAPKALLLAAKIQLAAKKIATPRARR